MSKNRDPRRCKTALPGQKMTSNLKTLTHEAYVGMTGDEEKRGGGDWGREKCCVWELELNLWWGAVAGLLSWGVTNRVRRNIVVLNFWVVLKLYHLTCSSNKIFHINLISRADQSRTAQLRLGWKTQNFLAWPPPHSSPGSFVNSWDTVIELPFLNTLK